MMRYSHPQTSHNMVVGLTLVYRQLLSTIRQVEYFHMPAKSLFVYAVLPFHLAVAMKRGYLNPLFSRAII